MSTESLEQYIKDFFREVEERKRKASSEEYVDWLYDYVSANGHADSESALYTYKGKDAENGELLSFFLDYVKELSDEQNIPVTCDEECEFGNELVYIKIKDKYFEVFQMYGQGCWTQVCLLKDEPDCKYIIVR